MKKAPCVRFASLIRPKIRENPEDSRNSRPPSDRLLRPWMIQNCIVRRSHPEDLCDCQPRMQDYGSKFFAGRLSWTKTRLGVATLAILAPATLETKCRCDIVME